MKKSFCVPVVLLAFTCLLSCSKVVSGAVPPENWYEALGEYSSEKIDVLYFASTEVLSATDEDGKVSWRSLLVPADMAAIKGEMKWIERNMFPNDFNLVSPYYHQFTFDAIWKLDQEGFRRVYQQVADEACAAFDHYMAHEGKGRRFILAGFSQGAMLCLDVLRHMNDEQYSRMIACYSVGYRLSAEDLAHPHINPATGPDDTGVVVSFNSTMSREAIWPLVGSGSVACINPFNWKTDSTPATFSFDGTSNTVWVDQETQVLLVQTDNPDYYHSYYDLAPFFLDAGVSKDNLHHWDLLFYPTQIHDNALLRAASSPER